MPKSIAELEAAVRDAREARTCCNCGLDAYASAVRALTWAKAREAVEKQAGVLVEVMPEPTREFREFEAAELSILPAEADAPPTWLMRRFDALTALRDAEEQDT